MAIILTGDGGWASLDQGVAGLLAEQGVPSIGWSSLRYYWAARTPQEGAADLARIIRHYTAAWHVSRVVLVGYSFGADVLPFLANRLPAEVARQVSSIVLLAPSNQASFQFHVTDWIASDGDSRYPTPPEIERLVPPVTCVTDADDTDSVCHAMATGRSRVAAVVGHGHHFSGDYAQLASLVLRSLSPP